MKEDIHACTRTRTPHTHTHTPNTQILREKAVMNLYTCSYTPLSCGGMRGGIKIWLHNSVSTDTDKPANSEKICQTSSATVTNFIERSE